MFSYHNNIVRSSTVSWYWGACGCGQQGERTLNFDEAAGWRCPKHLQLVVTNPTVVLEEESAA